MSRIIAGVNAKNKAEAVLALQTLLESMEVYGPDEEVCTSIEVVDEGVSKERVEKEERA